MARFIRSVRLFSTTAINQTRIVKFKVSDEMIRMYEEKLAKEPRKEDESKKNAAIHTLKNPIVMGKICSERYRNVVKVAIPKHKFSEYFLMYVRENDHVYALDADNRTKAGDWVVLKRQKEPIDTGVEHTVDSIVFQYGNYIDPLTGRRALGLYYDDDIKKIEEIKLEV